MERPSLVILFILPHPLTEAAVRLPATRLGCGSNDELHVYTLGFPRFLIFVTFSECNGK
jgi:hypothetical protein